MRSIIKDKKWYDNQFEYIYQCEDKKKKEKSTSLVNYFTFIKYEYI